MIEIYFLNILAFYIANISVIFLLETHVLKSYPQAYFNITGDLC
jgi:hypothetical protein